MVTLMIRVVQWAFNDIPNKVAWPKQCNLQWLVLPAWSFNHRHQIIHQDWAILMCRWPCEDVEKILDKSSNHSIFSTILIFHCSGGSRRISLNYSFTIFSLFCAKGLKATCVHSWKLMLRHIRVVASTDFWCRFSYFKKQNYKWTNKWNPRNPSRYTAILFLWD